ncbi:cupredoxin domain-containing protein [Nitrospira sp. M1]
MALTSLVCSQDVAWAETAGASVESEVGTQFMTITMESYTFTPHMLVGDVGQPIEILLKNESFLVPHNFLLDSPDGVRLIEANIDSGEQATIRFTPTQSGIHTFYCDKQLLFFPDHREEGMEGMLTVR